MSKELESLKNIESISERISFHKKYKLGDVDYQWIKVTIIDNVYKIEKALKALEIIKEKNVDIYAIKCCNSATQYNIKERIQVGRKILSEEEYYLLKEVLQ